MNLKLTPAQIRRCRQQWLFEKYDVKTLALLYDVSQSCIYALINNQTAFNPHFRPEIRKQARFTKDEMVIVDFLRFSQKKSYRAIVQEIGDSPNCNFKKCSVSGLYGALHRYLDNKAFPAESNGRKS